MLEVDEVDGRIGVGVVVGAGGVAAGFDGLGDEVGDLGTCAGGARAADYDADSLWYFQAHCGWLSRCRG